MKTDVRSKTAYSIRLLFLPAMLLLFPLRMAGQIPVAPNPVVAGTFGRSFSYHNTQNSQNREHRYGRSTNDIAYRFTLTTKMDVIISHCGSSLSDTYLHLLDAGGNRIAYNDESTGFVNWRMALTDVEEKERIKERFSHPLEGILFDVRNNAFWDDEWGEKRDRIENQINIVEQHYKKYPVLIPIYSHRYIPAHPIEVGNPIISVYQTDIIYYGNDMISYFCNEFNIKLLKYNAPECPKYIEFWGKMAT